MNRFIIIIIILSVGIPFISAGDVPALVNPREYDSEYELDVLQNYYESSMLWEWLSAENAFRITGGSLNIRHIYHDRSVKLRIPVIQNRLWFRYAYKQRQVIEDEWGTNEIELEYSPIKQLFLSAIGDPAYHKSDIDVGWQVRYGSTEDNSISVGYFLIDYDTNYAYHNKSVNEGYTEFYRDFPYEWRIKLITTQLPVHIWIEGKHRSAWTKEYNDFETFSHSAITAGRDYMIEGALQWQYARVTSVVDFFGRFNRESELYAIPRLTEDHQRWEKVLSFMPHGEIACNKTLVIDTGCKIVQHQGEDAYPLSLVQYMRFNSRHLMPFIFFKKHLTGSLTLETGYMHGTIDEQEIKNIVSSQNIRRENRVRLAIKLKFLTSAYLNIITGWDLDREDWGKFAIFDGGYVQFQGRL